MAEFTAGLLIAIVIAIPVFLLIELIGFIVEVPKQLKRIADSLESLNKNKRIL